MIIYIAGPMTGLPENNYPAFRAAAKIFRDLGHGVEDPSENGDVSPGSDPLTFYIRAGLAQVLRCDTIALLQGWQKSRGALLEAMVALRCGLRCIETSHAEYREGDGYSVEYVELSHDQFRDKIKRAIAGRPNVGWWLK